jgi:predicted Zn-dependent protease
MKPILVVLAASVLWAQPEDAAANAQRARELVVAGKVEEAIPIYLELAREFPDNAAILVNLSVAEFKAMHYRDAAAHASAALRLQPDSPAANLFLGSSYEELGEHLLALPPLERVLAGNPQERNARLMLAEALLNLERYEEAAAQFQKASELAPENPKVWYGLGRAFDALSENAFRQLENAGPESQYWHALVADQYLRQRRYGNAFAQYRLALEGHDTLRGVHAGIATVYKRTGHSAWADIETQREPRTAPDCSKGGMPCDFVNGRFREIVQFARSPTTPETLFWVYKAYAEMAHGAYVHLSQLPPSLEAYLHRAKTLDDEGLHREAADAWREELKLQPGDLRIETALAWSLFRAHEFSAALPVLTELLQKEHDSRDLNFLCGATLVNLDESEKAIPPLEAAIRLDGNFLPAHAALGRALLQTAKPELAIPHLQAALSGDEDASVHFELLRAYQLAGQPERAAQAKIEYQKALRAAEAKERLEEGGLITAP